MADRPLVNVNEPAGPASSSIRIVADYREARSAAVTALQSMDGVEVCFDHLELGDYRVNQRMLFERKRLTDLAESIIDGRLFRQAWALAGLSGSMRGAIILEGKSADLAGSGMSRESMQGALITITLFFEVPIIRALSAEETARLMIYAARQGNVLATGALPRLARRPKGKRKTQLAILQSLPGVGSQRAEQLLDTFGSVEAVMAARAAQLESVPGIGGRTANAIRWVVSEAEAVYHPKDVDDII